MPHLAQSASPPRLPRLGLPGPAPSSLPQRTRGRILPHPHLHPRTEGVPVLLHTLGKVPGSRGCLWGACDAQARPCASAYRVKTANCSGSAQSAGRPQPGCGREGAHVRTYARAHAHPGRGAPRSPATRHAVTWGHRGLPAREAAREPAAGCVSRLHRLLCAAWEPAPPARRSRLAAAAAPGTTMDTASHSLVLLQQLNMQREFGFLCDCTVAIGDVYFKAHRAVLAAFSNYFKMIFIHQTRYITTLRL
uniref:Zinc finger and BTB domain containing 25 n=1 Tax=Piliocolobus tephrosceles TaxID=591936 RepID=A0A8C9IWI1_9PRIM